MSESLRQTGRTTRMLKEAERLRVSGEKVCVMMASCKEVNRVQSILGDYIKCESVTHPNWGWKRMKLLHLDEDTIYLVDHYAIEKDFEHIFEMLHRFDLE